MSSSRRVLSRPGAVLVAVLVAVLLAVLGLTRLSSADAATTTRYVGSSSPAAQDSTANHQGESAAHPWRTLQYAVDTAPSGSTIRLAAGTYRPTTISRDHLTVTGPKTAVVTGGVVGQDVVTVRGSYDTLAGFKVTGCMPDRNASPIEDDGTAQVRVDDATTDTALRSLTVADSHLGGVADPTQQIGCYGVMIHGAAKVVVRGSDISGNGMGVYVRRAGAGVRIMDNQIHDNDVLIRSTGDVFGAVGVFLDHTTVSPGAPVVRGNSLYDNVAPSTEFGGTDGGATEVFAATGATFDSNLIRDNDDVFESGTDIGPNGRPNACNANRFTNNTVMGTTSSSSPAENSRGMYVRCAMTISGNHFTSLAQYMIEVVPGDSFGGDVTGLTVTGNTFDQPPPSSHPQYSDLTYGLKMSTGDVAGYRFHFDDNHFRYTGSLGTFIDGNESYHDYFTLAQLQSTYHLDLHSDTDVS